MIAIIDYGMGNLASIAKALEYVGGVVLVTKRIEDLQKAQKIVLPGVGAFAEGMAQLKKQEMVSVLNELVLKQKKPFLGICLGMQLLAKKSYEFGEYDGLGFIDAEVKKIDFLQANQKLSVPHVGWNNVQLKKESVLMEGVEDNSDFYFVHSYHMVCNDNSDVVGTTDYGREFTSIVGRENIFATQFHPEKSQKDGLKILENFVEWEIK